VTVEFGDAKTMNLSAADFVLSISKVNDDS
jgi:hypothetical protein